MADASSDGPDILGIWSCPPNATKASYADSVTAMFSVWADVLGEGQLLVAGDFNVGFPIARDGKPGYARQLVRTWDALGLVRVCHAFFDVQMGQPGDVLR